MAYIVASLLSSETITMVEDYCKVHSHRFASVEINKFIETHKRDVPDVYIFEIMDMDFDMGKGLEKIKKDPAFKKTTFFAYLNSMDVKTEIALRRLKVDTFLLKGKQEDEGRKYLINSLNKHFELEKSKHTRILEKEKKFDGRITSELEKREKGEIDINELASQFDSMVLNQVGDGDVDTHYNLGQSYLEMGLYDNAIKSFSLSAKSTEMFLASCHMIGVCYYRQGKKEKAVSTLFAGFKSHIEKKEAAGIGYELGNILTEMDRKKDALKIFQFVEKIDPDFMDIKEKFLKLKEDI